VYTKAEGIYMNYLFFDIECCDGKHICEFGYVLTDETFQVLDTGIYLMNPEKPFSLTGRPNKKDFKLSFPESSYRSAPTFPHFYETVRDLIYTEDQMIFGHAIDNDAKFLRTACKRYGLPYLNFSFADTQQIYADYVNSGRRVSLADAEASLDSEQTHCYHRSDGDAEATMTLLKGMCDDLNCSVQELLTLCPYSTGSIYEGEIKLESEGRKWEDALRDLTAGNISAYRAHELITRYGNAVWLNEQSTFWMLGYRVCFDTHFEETRTADVLALLYELADVGAVYESRVSAADIFVRSPQMPEDEPRWLVAKELNRDSENLEIMTLNEFLEIMDVTEEYLADCPLPTFEELKPSHQNRKRILARGPQKQYSFGDTGSTTLGDLFGDFAKTEYASEP
jgi:DNA polymerase III epsilon subunit-like protein